MSEEKQETKEGKPEETDEDPKDGIQQETVSELDRADQIAERQKRENDRREKILDREEALAARKVVGGTIEAGQKEPEKPKETAQEYSKRMHPGL